MDISGPLLFSLAPGHGRPRRDACMTGGARTSPTRRRVRRSGGLKWRRSDRGAFVCWGRVVRAAHMPVGVAGAAARGEHVHRLGGRRLPPRAFT
jgi:hypothetical protein